MKLVPATRELISPMLLWFPSEPELRQWAGPGFRFPYTPEQFYHDLKLDALASYCLFDEAGEFIAFGQFYNRLQRCHLGRLVIAPDHRGKGLARYFVEMLERFGRQELELSASSLFVLQSNKPALRCYQKLGFKISEYPGGLESFDMPGLLFLTKNT